MSLPGGVDRADGLDGRPGTPAPDGAVLVSSAAGGGQQPLEEQPSSPQVERGEQCTITRDFTVDWDSGVTLLSGLGRGTVVYNTAGDIVTRVLSSRLQHGVGSTAHLNVVEESVSFDSPPDEFDCQPVELGVNILKYPRYLYAFLGANPAERQYNQQVVRAVQDYMENPSYPTRNAIVQALVSSFGNEAGDEATGVLSGTDLAKAAALEVIQKYWRNEETPLLAGVEVVWSVYYFRPPHLNLGGYVEDPVSDANPQLPDYFWVTEDGDSIFALLAELNPQCYSGSGMRSGEVEISWLRKPDRLHYQRTWFKLDRIWFGAPVGLWDPELYSSGERPSAPGDYLPFNSAQQPDYQSSS